MNELALFAGAGGGILGGHLLGWRTVCAVEWEPYPASVLCARQNDGLLPPFPIWDDIQTFDGRLWRGIVDVVSGGFPCQDISPAGKGAGIEGERSGMWREMARVVSEVRPQFVFVENSPMLVTRGLERVLGDLTEIGYDTRWTVMGAADVGAPHQRDRIWICARRRDILSHSKHNWNGRWEQQSESIKESNVADPDSIDDAMRGNSKNYEEGMGIRGNEFRGSVSNSGSGCEKSSRESSNVDNSNGSHGEGNQRPERTQPQHANADSAGQLAIAENTGSVRWVGSQTDVNQKTWGTRGNRGVQWWEAEPDLGRVADGVAARVDRLKAIGNGQVSEVARRAWEVLNEA